MALRDVARTRGSNRVQAQPAGNADMSFPGSPGKPQNSGTSIYGSRIRRLNRRQQVAVGPADRQQVGAGSACPGAS